MFYKFNSFLVIIFFCNTFFSQSLSSAPHTVKDIYHSSQSLWLIGESDQNGGGVYKYENKKWYYFKIENAERITATSSNIPVIINNAKHLGDLQTVFTHDQIPIESNEQLNKIYKDKEQRLNRNKPTDDGWDI